MPIYASARDAMRAEGWGGEIAQPDTVIVADSGDNGGSNYVGVQQDFVPDRYIGVQQDFGPQYRYRGIPVSEPKPLSGDPYQRAFAQWFDFVPLPIGGKPRIVQRGVDFFKDWRSAKRTASAVDDFLRQGRGGTSQTGSSPSGVGSGGATGRPTTTRTGTGTGRKTGTIAKNVGVGALQTSVNTAAVGAGVYLMSQYWGKNPYTIQVVDKTSREPVTVERFVKETERVVPVEQIKETTNVTERIVEKVGGAGGVGVGGSRVVGEPPRPGVNYTGPTTNITNVDSKRPTGGAEIPISTPGGGGGGGGGGAVTPVDPTRTPSGFAGYGGGSNPSAGCVDYVRDALQSTNSVAEARELIASTRSECLDELRKLVS